MPTDSRKPFAMSGSASQDQTYHQRTCLLKRVAADFLNEGVGLVVELWEADMNASSTETRRQGLVGICCCKAISAAIREHLAIR